MVREKFAQSEDLKKNDFNRIIKELPARGWTRQVNCLPGKEKDNINLSAQ